MESQAIIGVILLLIVAGVAIPQSRSSDQGSAPQTQVRGIWTDTATGLVWAAKDNGQDVSWKRAVKYCRDSRLAGYSDWRLASLSELEGIYDKINVNRWNAACALHRPSGKCHQ